MKTLKASFGHLVLLMPEEQNCQTVIEAISKLNETGKVVIFISGCESMQGVICKLIKKSM